MRLDEFSAGNDLVTEFRDLCRLKERMGRVVNYNTYRGFKIEVPVTIIDEYAVQNAIQNATFNRLQHLKTKLAILGVTDFSGYGV